MTGAVFFDAVGTLLHPDPPAVDIYAEAGRRHGSHLSTPQIVSRFRAAFQRQEHLDRQSGLRTDEHREWHRWMAIVAEVFDDVADKEGCFRELWDHFAKPEAWRVEADAGPTLAELARAGWQLGIASNFDARLRRIVAGLTPLAPIGNLLISSEVGWRKPAAPFFEQLCQAVRLPPGQIVLVGDDLVNDHEGARAAGLGSLLLDREDSVPLPGTEKVTALALVPDRLLQEVSFPPGT